MINKAMIEIPPKFAGQPPVNPEAQRNKLTEDDWSGTRGLAEDVRYYGEWMKRKAFEKIGHLYPKVKDAEGREHTVIAWLWTRTVKCPNPACGCEMPLASSFILSKKRNNEIFVEPTAENGKIHYFVRRGKDVVDGTVARSGGRCVFCNTPVGFDYIRGEGKAHRIASQLMAVAAKGDSGRIYISPDEEQISAAFIQKPSSYPSGELHGKSRVNVGLYGFNETSDLFTNRQLVALTTFCDLVTEVREQIERDVGSVEYAQAVSVYLALSIDKLTNISSAIVSWMNDRGALRETFARQAIPMVWDYAESNPFSKAGGSWEAVLDKVVNVIRAYPRVAMGGNAVQFDAQLDKEGRNVMVSTDPPYYDNISYADLSDFFYVWLRKNLKDIYPELFKTMLVPKIEELVATPYRFGGQKDQAKKFFEEGMLQAVTQIKIMAREDIPISIYYAFKQRELDKVGDKQRLVSTGWETMLSAILQVGLSITGTWTMKTESSGRANSQKANALASSIVLVCRKRKAVAATCTRKNFLRELKRELASALAHLQASNIAPVDMAQSAIGPGIGTDERTASLLGRLLRSVDQPLLLDADALNLLARNRELIPLLPPGTVLTPHPREFDRLFGESANGYDRLHKAATTAVKHAICIVLKGAYTAVCAPQGQIYFNTTGNPGMATAGSGDVLTGVIAALMAQRYDPVKAAIIGVFLHGSAGDLAAARSSEESLVASDIVHELGRAFRMQQADD